MAITQTQIVNSALIALGHPSIVSLDNGDSLVQNMVSQWDVLLNVCLCTGTWMFSLHTVALSLMTEQPPAPWIGQYRLPADYLKTHQLYRYNGNWKIVFNEKIYAMTNQPLSMEYVALVDVSHFPAYFADYFSFFLADYFSLSYARADKFAERIKSEVISKRAIALAIDAQNAPTDLDFSYPALANRYGYTGAVYGYWGT